MSDVCAVHGQPWKLVPAGISSKTGRAYPAFQVCPVKGCGMRPNNVPHPVPAGLSPAVPAPVLNKPEVVSGDALAIAAMEFAGKVFDGAVARNAGNTYDGTMVQTEMAVAFFKQVLEIARSRG